MGWPQVPVVEATARCSVTVKAGKARHEHMFSALPRWRTWVHCGKPRLPVGSANDVHQLNNLLALIGLVAAGDRPFDAMRHVISQHFFLDAPKRGADGRDLRDDIDAIAVLINHF